MSKKKVEQKSQCIEGQFDKFRETMLKGKACVGRKLN